MLGAPTGVLGAMQPLAYTAVATEVLALALWIRLRRRRPAWSAAAGSLIAEFSSFALGAAVLPFSIMGIFYSGLGLLGLIPFAAGLVYLRAGREAVRLRRAAGGSIRPALLLGAAAAVPLPLIAQFTLTGISFDAIYRDIRRKPATSVAF